MDRRAYVGGLLTGLGALAGCAGRGGSGETSPDESTPTNDSTPTPNQGGTAPGDIELPLSKSAMHRALPKDAIPAITEPAFGPDWSEVDGLSLTPDDQVIGVERDGNARAYPLRILDWHEVVNDEFAGPLLVTFCPLCGSGVTAERRVNGEVTNFGVSGYLWQSDLVMYDALTDSLWSQILGKAVRGPKTGTSLSLLPSQLTRLRTWRESYPDTEVMLPPPESKTVTGDVARYDQRGYQGYDQSDRIGIGQNDFDDDRLHPKTIVIGITHDDVARAYSLPAVTEAGVINDSVSGLPVVVAALPGGSLVAYERTVDGSVLEFSRADDRHLAAGDSRWALQTGRAIDGQYEGTQLTQANDRSQMFWFAWADFHPETELYGN
ncbi:MAG: DUF3179 domain-containing protein [Salinirussus sp.]